MTQLCYYCGSTYDLIGGHRCTPATQASSTATATIQPVWAIPVSLSQPTLNASQQWLCPDLLRYSQIGAADGWRGRLVRGFFWLLRAWPPKG